MFTEPADTVATAVSDTVEPPTAPSPAAAVPTNLKTGEPGGGSPRILEEVVIEEVSIDGMCGVY